MRIHFSILAVILIVSLSCDRYYTRKKLINKNYKMPLGPWLIVFGYISFLAAMRSGMNDTPVYIWEFERYEGTWQAAVKCLVDADIRYGFTNFLGNIFKAVVSQNYHVWFLLFAVIQSIGFVYVFRRESYGMLIPCFFFFTSTLYYNFFSMLRQWTAVAIMFYGFEWLKEKKWVKYLLCCFVAGLFHSSAYICIAFAFLSQGTPWKRKQTFILVMSTLGVIFLSPLLSVLANVTDGGTYDYAIEAMLTNSGSSPVRIIIAAVPVILAYSYRSVILSDENPGINICTNMSIFYFFLNIVAAMTSGLYVIRLATYLVPYSAILYSYLLRKAVKPRDRQIILAGFYLFYFLFYCYQMTYMGAWGYRSNILGNF